MTADTSAPAGAALLTPEQAWTYLGVSKTELYRLSREGLLAFVKFPAKTEHGDGYRRYEVAELDRYITANRQVQGA